MNILIIEDDIILAKNISHTFASYGYIHRVRIIESYNDFLFSGILLYSFDMVLLDIDLGNPKHQGFDILQYIRQKSPYLPVVMISSYSDILYLQKSFMLGAHDYLVKPFRIRELQVRIERWFRMYIFSEYYSVKKTLEYQHISYDISRYEFYISGKKIHLSKGNKYLFSLFLIYREKLLRKDFLIDKIWGFDETSKSKNLGIKVMRLKKQLEQTDIAGWIQSVKGEGYIFQKI